MRKALISIASAAALTALPGIAWAQQGAAAGAATGAVVGGAVGGPVGAAVGAGVGATTGAANDATRPRDTVVVTPNSTGSVEQRSTTCVQGATSSTCTETTTRR